MFIFSRHIVCFSLNVVFYDSVVIFIGRFTCNLLSGAVLSMMKWVFVLLEQIDVTLFIYGVRVRFFCRSVLSLYIYIFFSDSVCVFLIIYICVFDIQTVYMILSMHIYICMHTLMLPRIPFPSHQRASAG